MSQHEASRTLVKSPPELWTECSDAGSLARHLNQSFGEIRITKLDPETSVAWEGERVSGTVRIEPSGWGTKVTFTWYGVNVEGHSNNSKVQEVEYTTGPNENKVTAHLTAPEDWPKGSYRVETEVNGKPDKSVEYTVE